LTTHKVFPLLALLIAALTPVGAAAQQPATAPAFQVLRPGDIIRISVWRDPSITGEYVVDERGRVSLPFLGEIEVAGVQRDLVRDRIRTSFAASIQDLSMQLFFLRRVAIVGAVRTPGLYPADATMTVGDLVGLAGGSILDQEQWRVKWLRDGRVMENDVSPARQLAGIDLQPGDQLLVPGRGWLSRNAGTILGPVTSIAVALLIYRR
jgi:protein involved in polysaccharide export with SLBB domain